MKFIEALGTVQSLSHQTIKGRVWFLSSYNPFIFSTYLQAGLMRNAVGKGKVLQVEISDYDQLYTVLKETSQENPVYEPAILSLTWEDFDPSLGWRGRGFENRQKKMRESVELRAAVIDWAKARSQKGISIVLLPTNNWLVPNEALPDSSVTHKGLIFDTYKTELARALIDLGCFVMDPQGLSLNVREMLHAGCPWTIEDAKKIALKLADSFEPKKQLVKAVIVDLDNTLWPGVLEDGSAFEAAEVEWKNRPFQVFAQILLNIKDRGLLLGCCSKNDSAEVQKAFKALQPSITFDDFNAVSINWDLKSKGLHEICHQLNVLPENVLFIDDNPAELLEVKSVYPEIMTLQAPGELGMWPSFYNELKEFCFVPRQLTIEDSLRVQKRPESNHGKGYLKTLKLKMHIHERVWEEPRTLDLVNKTNQFNLNAIRYTPQEIQEYKQHKNRWCFSVKLADIYGDFGTIAVLWGDYEQSQQLARIDTFVLSCRVFDRNVEYAILEAIFKKFDHVKTIELSAKKTPKNKKLFQFLETMGLSWDNLQLVNKKEVRDFLKTKMEEAGLEMMEVR